MDQWTLEWWRCIFRIQKHTTFQLAMRVFGWKNSPKMCLENRNLAGMGPSFSKSAREPSPYKGEIFQIHPALQIVPFQLVYLAARSYVPPPSPQTTTPLIILRWKNIFQVQLFTQNVKKRLGFQHVKKMCSWRFSQSQHFKLKTRSENFRLPDTFTKKVIVILNFPPECNPCFISLVFSLKTSQKACLQRKKRPFFKD